MKILTLKRVTKVIDSIEIDIRDLDGTPTQITALAFKIQLKEKLESSE